jgi:hypothetical protein
MTTKDSPLSAIKIQADKIAILLKAAERGANISSYDPSGRITAARNKPTVTFAVVMDDKVLKVEMSWATIKATSEAGISEYLVRQMREAVDTAQ